MYRHSFGVLPDGSGSGGKTASDSSSDSFKKSGSGSTRRESTSTSIDQVFSTVSSGPRQERDTNAFATNLLAASQRGATSEDNAVMYALIAGGVGLVLIAGIAITAIGKKKPVSANRGRSRRKRSRR